jgi:Integrase core domain/HTH-like domain
VLSISERRACAALGQHRSTQRKIPRGRADEERLTTDIIELARQYGRYGYRKNAELLRRAGWLVNDKRVERIWRREGLKVPARQPKRARLWLNDGSCIRLRAERPNHVWSYDLLEERTHEGRKIRLLNIIDEFTHECLAIRVSRRLKSVDVIDVLSDLFILRGIPEHIRSDNGPEFLAKAVQEWIAAVGAKTISEASATRRIGFGVGCAGSAEPKRLKGEGNPSLIGGAEVRLTCHSLPSEGIRKTMRAKKRGPRAAPVAGGISRRMVFAPPHQRARPNLPLTARRASSPRDVASRRDAHDQSLAPRRIPAAVVRTGRTGTARTRGASQGREWP